MVFAFSGFNLLHLMHVNMIAVVSHAPWILLAAHVLLTSADSRARAWAFAGVALLLASQLLLGFPQCVWMTGFAVGVLAVLCGRTAPRRVVLLLGALALGILVSGIQLLPSLDLARASWRSKLWVDFQLSLSLPPWNLVQLWSPFAFQARIYASPEDFNPHELGVYNGAFCTIAVSWLAVRWDALKHRGLIGALLAFAGISLIFALGRYGGAWIWLAQLPGLNGFRAPARHLVLFHLALSGIAAVVFDDLVSVLRRGELIALRRFWPLAIPVVLSLVTTASAAALTRLSWTPANGARLSSLAQAGPWSVLMFVVASLMVMAGRGRPGCVAALVVTTALDLGWWGYGYIYQGGPVQTLEAVAARASVPDGAMRGDLYEPIEPGAPANLGALRGLRVSWAYVGLDPPSRLVVSDPGTLRLAGAIWRVDGQSWSRVPDPMPRARLVSVARPSDHVARDIHDIDISLVALVDRPVTGLAGPAGSARVIRDRPGSIAVETAASAKQLLIVTERFHDGWLATEDGRPRQTTRVYGDYLGAVVEPGTHVVAFSFAPASFRNGMWLSSVGLGLTLIATLILWRFGDRLGLRVRRQE
jgi:hypothetical protein